MIKSSKVKIFKIFGVILCILSMTSCKPYLNKIKETKILIDYVEFYHNDNTKYSFLDFRVDYYVGKFNDYYVLMISMKPGLHGMAIGKDIFDDITIEYGNTNRLKAYKTGEFYRLPELYKTGELTKEDIVKIRDTFYDLEQ